MKLRRRLFDPDHARGPSRGVDVRMVKRALGKVEQSLLPPRPGGYDDVFNRRMEKALDVFRRSTPGLERRRGKPFDQPDLDELEPYFDAYGRWRYRLARVPSSLPDLGPIVRGQASVLDMFPTHNTDGTGLETYVGIDTAWGEGGGVSLIAPEDLTVDKKDSSASPGEAFYATGASGAKYWIGHIDRNIALGTTFHKGQFMAKTIDGAHTDHAHIGLNVEAFLGKGKILAYGRTGRGPDYTDGSPSVRKQLEAALA